MTFSHLIFGAGHLFVIGRLYPLGKANGEDVLAKCVAVDGDLVTFAPYQRGKGAN